MGSPFFNRCKQLALKSRLGQRTGPHLSIQKAVYFGYPVGVPEEFVVKNNNKRNGKCPQMI